MAIIEAIWKSANKFNAQLSNNPLIYKRLPTLTDVIVNT